MSDNLNLRYTGNVFVDAGLSALTTKFKINPEEIKIEHLKELAKEISEIYIKEGWKNNTYSIFTTNNKLNNPSIKENKQEAYLNFLNDLINNIGDLEENSDCVACGCRKSYELFQKHIVPLSGSKNFKNYFPYAIEGLITALYVCYLFSFLH